MTIRAVHGAVRLALALAVASAAPAVAQQRPSMEVSVGEAGAGRVPIVTVRRLLHDRALEDALESGLPLRFRFRVELWRKGFFDRLEGAQESYFAVVRDPIDRLYVLDTGRGQQPFAGLAEAERGISAILRPTLRPDRAGRHYYLAVLEIETLSLSDLDELRRWLRGEVQEAVEGRAPVSRALESGVRRALVRLIGIPTRKYEARSATFLVR